VRFAHGDGSASHGFIDCYERGAFVLSAHPLPLSAPDIEARFTARGRWRERLPRILDTLEASQPAARPN
jgi:hypothetical protein